MKQKWCLLFVEKKKKKQEKKQCVLLKHHVWTLRAHMELDLHSLQIFFRCIYLRLTWDWPVYLTCVQSSGVEKQAEEKLHPAGSIVTLPFSLKARQTRADGTAPLMSNSCRVDFRGTASPPWPRPSAVQCVAL